MCDSELCIEGINWIKTQHHALKTANSISYLPHLVFG